MRKMFKNAKAKHGLNSKMGFKTKLVSFLEKQKKKTVEEKGGGKDRRRGRGREEEEKKR